MPLMVELANLALAIDPANMLLVTVPVSVVYTPLVTVLALPVRLPTNPTALVTPVVPLNEATLTALVAAVLLAVA